MTSFPRTDVKLPLHERVSIKAPINNDRTRILDKDDVVFLLIILVMKYAVEIMKLILAGGCTTTK